MDFKISLLWYDPAIIFKCIEGKNGRKKWGEGVKLELILISIYVFFLDLLRRR